LLVYGKQSCNCFIAMTKKIVKSFLLLTAFLTIFLLYHFYGIFNAGVVNAPVLETGFTNDQKPAESPATSTESAAAPTESAPVLTPDFTNDQKPAESPATSTEPAPALADSHAQVIKLDVPFTPQAPFGEWSDLRQQNACEEAAVIMAMYWVRGQSLSPQEAKDKIIAISDWEQQRYGIYQDTSARDTAERIFKEYFEYQKVNVVNNITLQDIINELTKNNLVIAPANGQTLNNPFFNSPGPERHMIVITGYDYRAKEFITNDPGTKRGQDYRYDQDVLFNAIRDYETGYHQPIAGIKKNMIVVQK